MYHRCRVVCVICRYSVAHLWSESALPKSALTSSGSSCQQSSGRSRLEGAGAGAVFFTTSASPCAGVNVRVCVSHVSAVVLQVLSTSYDFFSTREGVMSGAGEEKSASLQEKSQNVQACVGTAIFNSFMSRLQGDYGGYSGTLSYCTVLYCTVIKQ